MYAFGQFRLSVDLWEATRSPFPRNVPILVGVGRKLARSRSSCSVDQTASQRWFAIAKLCQLGMRMAAMHSGWFELSSAVSAGQNASAVYSDACIRLDVEKSLVTRGLISVSTGAT